MVSNAAEEESSAAGRRRTPHAVRRDAAHLDLSDRAGRRGLPPGARPAVGRRPQSRCRSSAASRWPSSSTPRRSSRSPRDGFEVFERALRFPLPVRQVRPGLRPGVQRRRDGERRLRHAARRVPVPQQGDRRRRCTTAGTRSCTSSRTCGSGTWSPWRWWDDLWLKESFATWASTSRSASGPPTRPSPGRVRQQLQDPGLPARSTSRRPIRSPPTSSIWRRSSTTSTRSPTPRARRCWSSWWPTSAGRPSCAGCAAYFAEHAYGNTSLADLLRRLEQASGRDLSPGPRSGWRPQGVNTLRLELAVDDQDVITSAVVEQQARSPAAYPAPAPDCCWAATPSTAISWNASTASRPTCPARVRRCPSWSAGSGRTRS